MGAARLEAADARRVRALCDSLTTIRLAIPGSPWPDVVRETQALLDTEHVWCFQPRAHATSWELPVWYGGDSLPNVHARFAQALATGPREWAWFKPTCPDPTQRNCIVEALSRVTREKPGFFESSHLYNEFFGPLRLHRHRQLRVLLCDGARMLAWFGALQIEPVSARQRAILGALVPSLQRRLVAEDRLAAAHTTNGLLEASLERLGAAALAVGRRGEILHANTAARALLEDRRGELAGALVDAIAGRPHAPAFELVRIDDAAWLAIVTGIAPRTRADERVGDAATRWNLTPRRREVLALVIAGHSNAAIAARLGVTTRAIELHVTALLDRAGVDGRAALVAAVLAA